MTATTWDRDRLVRLTPAGEGRVWWRGEHLPVVRRPDRGARKGAIDVCSVGAVHGLRVDACCALLTLLGAAEAAHPDRPAVTAATGPAPLG